jgi:hypothetical protein
MGKDLSVSKLAFAVAYCGLEARGLRPPRPEDQEAFTEIFDNEEGREWLCLLATYYFDTFQGAPVPLIPEVEKFGRGRCLADCRGRLRGEYLIPLFGQIFPELNSCHYGRFEDWLQKDGQVESLLESARAHMGTIPQPDTIRPKKEDA